MDNPGDYADRTEVGTGGAADAPERAMDSSDTRSMQHSFAVCAQALGNQPDNAMALGLIESLCRRTGCYDLAVSVLSRTLLEHPHAVNAHALLAKLLIQSGRGEEAVYSCRQAVAFNPQSALCYFNLGLALQATGSLKEAVEAYLNSLDLDDTKGEAYEKLKSVLTPVIEHYDRAGHPLVNGDRPVFQNLPQFRTNSRKFLVRQPLAYDERLYERDTVYLTDHAFIPPVFSIQSPWGPLAHDSRSYPLFLKVRNSVVEKVRHRLVAHDESFTPIPLSYLPVVPLTAQNPFISADRSFGLYGFKEPSHTVFEPCVIVESCLQCFAHFMHDYLPYILLAHTLSETKHFKIAVASINANEERFLEYLQVPRDKIVTFAELTTGRENETAVRFANAYYPIHLPLPVVIEVIRRAFKCSSDERFDKDGRKIFISRLPGPQVIGRIENERLLSETLAKIGFETVVPELLTIEEQVRLFSNARIIIGAAGSGMFSQVWAPRGAVVITLMSQENYRYAIKETEGYQQVSACLGQLYYRLLYNSLLNTEEVTPGSCEVEYDTEGGRQRVHIANVPYRCNPDEIVRVVEAVLHLQQRTVSP